MPDCSKVTPQLSFIDDGHEVSCLLYESCDTRKGVS